MSKEYKIVATGPDNIESFNVTIKYEANYRDGREKRAKTVAFMVPIPWTLKLAVAPRITTAEDLKKVVWAETRSWFERKLTREPPDNYDVLQYPDKLDCERLLELDPSEISYPEDWVPLEDTLRQEHIFICCGQEKAEAALGKEVVNLVEGLTKYEGYFAENQSTNSAIINNIYQKLQHPTAVIVIMHHRGKVHKPDGEKFQRASVWCEQEIAITAFQSSLDKEIPMRIYAQEGIRLEGIRDFLPKTITFKSNGEVIEDVKEWLRSLPDQDSYQMDMAKLQPYIDQCKEYWKEHGTPIAYLKTSGLTKDQQLEVYKAAWIREHPQERFTEERAAKAQKQLGIDPK